MLSSFVGSAQGGPQVVARAAAAPLCFWLRYFTIKATPNVGAGKGKQPQPADFDSPGRHSRKLAQGYRGS